MAAYYVFGILLVVWGLGLALFGLTRADFPPSGQAGRALVGATVLLVVGTLTALLLSTKKEHPREEAAAKAAEAKAPPAGGAPAQQPSPAGSAAPATGGKTVKVAEKEFSIALAGGNKLKAGQYTFAVQNTGTIQHDLAIVGAKLKEAKTPLINGGQSQALKVNLQPGKYKFFCTVPGHEQSGMKVDVTVTGKPSAPAKQAKPKPAKRKRAKAKRKRKAPSQAAKGVAKTVPVAEKEFSIALSGGNTLKAGSYTFSVKNIGKIQHDLAIAGGGQKEQKTPLLSAGQQKTLKVALKPGKYKFFCTVPGHEQAGMKVDVTVR